MQYVYPGLIVLFIYQYINGNGTEETDRFFLKIVCISYIIVKIIGSQCNIFFSQFDFSENVIAIVNHVALILSSTILPFLFYKIQSSKLITIILEWCKIPRNTANNIEELILGNCPKNNSIYCVVYLENIALEGVLIHSETEENGSIILSNWEKKYLHESHSHKQSKKIRNINSTVVVPKNRILFFDYEYIPKSGKLPNKLPSGFI